MGRHGGGGQRGKWRKPSRQMALGDPRGFCGVMVMCDEGREERAMHEVADLLNDELDELFGPQVEASAADGSAEADAGGAGGAGSGGSGAGDGAPVVPPRSVADELQAELAALTGGSASGGGDAGGSGCASVAVTVRTIGKRLAGKRARWMDLDGRAIGLVWVKDNNNSSSSIAIMPTLHSIFNRVLQSKAAVTRHCTRLLPLERIVTPSLPDIIAAVKALVDAKLDAAKPTTWKVEFRSRNNQQLRRSDVIDAVTHAMPSPHRASVSDPRAIVLIEVAKNIAGVSLITDGDWDKYQRYNIRLCGETEEERAARLKKQEELDAAARAAKQATASTAAATSSSAVWMAPDDDVSKRHQDHGQSAGAHAEAGSGGAGGAGAGGAASSSAAAAAAAATTENGELQGEEEDDAAPAAKRRKLDSVAASGDSGNSDSASAVTGGPSAVKHRPTECEFLVALGGSAVATAPGSPTPQDEHHALLQYQVVSSAKGDILDITHTYTPTAARGRGIAAALATAAFSWAGQAAFAAIRPSCSYISDTFAPKHAAQLGWRADAATGLLLRAA